jgi:membrane fusion protein (multidrug efflux system)
VHSESLARELRALGTARANEAVEITSKLSNIVTAIRFADGQKVAKGQVLVELDSAQARADLSVAVAALTESTSQYNRAKELLSTQVVSRSQYDQLEATKTANGARVAAARAKLEDTVIRAPFSGRVGLRRISLGSLINPGAVITTLDDLGTMKVDFDVPENSLPLLRTGLPITAMSSAFPDRHFVGTVASIDSRIDPTTRSVTVRGVVPNPDGLLKPGMFLTIELTRDQRTALVIPEEALVPEQDKQFVYVVQNGKSLRREVRIGQRRPGSVEIVQGLALGERVVVEGTVKVRDGGAVRDSAAAAGAGPAAANPAVAAK